MLPNASGVDEGRPPQHDIPERGRSGYLRVGGRQIHYLEWGHAGLPAVVCLHGGGQTAYMYEELGAALAGRNHLLAWDLPDHGDSDPAPPGASLIGRHDLAAMVPAVCAEFGISRAVFVGASLGGVVSATVAAARPELVAGLVLVDVGHRLEPEGVRRITDFMTAHESFGSLEEAAEAIAAYLPQRAVVTGRLTRNLRQRVDGRWVWKHGLGRRVRSEPGFDFGQGASLLVAGLDDDLRSLGCPVLVLRGTLSDVLSEGGADELVSLIPRGRLAVVSGAGHLTAGDNPESFVGLVSAFVGEVAAGV